MKTRLRYWRRMRALTQQELADKAKVSNQTIVNIERYGKEPYTTTLRKLANALDIVPSDLFTEDVNQADGKADEEKPARRSRNKKAA